MTNPQERRILREAVQAALRFAETGATDLFTLDEPFALRFEDDEETWFGGISGAGLDEERCVIARGPAGLRWIWDDADGVDSDVLLERHVERIEFTLLPLADIDPARRGPLSRSGVAFLRDDLAPEFFAKRSNKSPRDLDLREAKRIAAAANALVEAFDAEEMDPALRTPGVLPMLALSGDWRSPTVHVATFPFRDDTGRSEPPVRRSAMSSSWPLLDARWTVGVVDEPLDPDDTGPFRTMVVADRDTEKHVILSHVVRTDPRHVAREFVRGFWAQDLESDRGFARDIEFVGQALCDAAAEALGPAGVACSAVGQSELIDRIRERIPAIRAEAVAELEALDAEDDDTPYDDEAPPEEDASSR